MNIFNQIANVFLKILAQFKNPFYSRPNLTIKKVSVNRCAWFWCVYTNDGPDRFLLRRLPVNIFSYMEALEIAQAHIGLPRKN